MCSSDLGEKGRIDLINEKLKELLKNAEKFDGLSFIKDRIANREQIRKEKREKLKELMSNETYGGNK